MKSVKDDFLDFVVTEESKDASNLSEEILRKVEKDLNPSRTVVFTRLFGIHGLMATLSLLVCPQFGLQVFRQQPSLAEAFSSLGEYGCHVACGFFFMGSTLLVAALTLTKDEVRTVRGHRPLFLGTLVFVSLGLFLISSPEILFQGIALAWLFSAFLSGSVFLELGWKLRGNHV